MKEPYYDQEPCSPDAARQGFQGFQKLSEDPWQHRSKHMRCATCMWWVEKTAGVGRCRRHAPTMNGYPVVYHNDWCGDHKVNEHAREMG